MKRSNDLSKELGEELLGKGAISTTFKDLLIFVAFAFLILVTWQFGLKVIQMPKYVLPTPYEIIRGIITYSPHLAYHSLVTLLESMAGLLAALLLGVGLAMAIVYSDILRVCLYPLAVGFQSTPKSAIAPIFLLWFGLGFFPKVMMAFVISFFPILINTISGLSDVNYTLIELVRSMKATKGQIFFRIRLPHSAPYIADGVKIALPLSFVGAIIGEFIGAQYGLGNVLLLAANNLDASLLFTAVTIVTVISLTLYQVFLKLERRFIWWREK